MKFPKVIFLMGLPGSGKTYLANLISKDGKIIHISSDRTRKVLKKNRHYQKEDKQLVYDEMQKQLELALQKNRNVIVDATFYLQKTRNDFFTIAKKYSKEICWILITADEETIKKRVSKKRPDSEADFEVYKLIRDRFEPLQIEYLEINTTELSAKENITRILKYCHLDYESISN